MKELKITFYLAFTFSLMVFLLSKQQNNELFFESIKQDIEVVGFKNYIKNIYQSKSINLKYNLRDYVIHFMYDKRGNEVNDINIPQANLDDYFSNE